VLLALGVFFGALLGFWFFVARPADRSYEERRMALQRRRIQASLRRNTGKSENKSPDDDDPVA
jgi:hypothetical protein